MYKHWKMLLSYNYLTPGFQPGGHRKRIRKKASLPVAFIAPAWYHPCVHFEVTQYTLPSDRSTVLSTHCSGILGKVALQLRAKYLSGHHCVERKVLVSTTVMTCLSLILSNKLS